MKKINYLFLLFIFSIVLNACSKNINKHDHLWVDGFCSICKTEEYSEGLEYQELGNNELLVLGRGSNADSKLIIPSKLDGKKVIGIAENAFSNCMSSDVKISEGIEYIGSNAFSDSLYIENVELPNSLKHISDTALIDPYKMNYNEYNGGYYLGNNENPYLFLHHIDRGYSGFVIHKDTKFIGQLHKNYSMYKLTELSEVYYLASEDNPYFVAVSLTASKEIDVEIHKDAEIIASSFASSSFALEKLNIPNNIRYIGTRAFEKSKINNIKLSNSIYAIEQDTFNAAKATNIELSKGIKFICKNAFKDTIINEIKIPSTLRYLGNYSFYNSCNLKSIAIPNDVKIIPLRAFSSCTSLTEITHNANRIEDYAFSDCVSLKKVTLPSSVEQLGEYSFAECKNLTKITLSDNLKRLEVGVFSNCQKLEDVILGNNIENIDISAFVGCKNIKYNSYNGCRYLPSKVNPNYAYMGKEYNLGDNEKIILHNKTKLIAADSLTYQDETIELPNSVRYISDYALANIKAIKLNNGLEKIGDYAFKNSKIESLIIPDSVTNMGVGAFKDCLNLTNIVIGSKLQELDNQAFSGCTNLKTITIKAKIARVGQKAFEKCGKLEEISFNEGLVEIENNAFANCNNLMKLTLPKSLKIVGDNVFLYSYQIKQLYYNGTVEDYKNIVFEGDFSDPSKWADEVYVYTADGYVRENPYTW